MKLFDVPRIEYREQRALAYSQKGRVDKWRPPAKSGAVTENGQAFYSLGELLVEQGYNPIQAIRLTFSDVVAKGLKVPEPKELLRVREEPQSLQDLAYSLTTSSIHSTVASIARGSVTSEFIYGAPVTMDPELMGEDLNPVLLYRAKESGGFTVDKTLKLAALRTYLYCPAAFRDHCPDDIPAVCRRVKVFEDFICKR